MGSIFFTEVRKGIVSFKHVIHLYISMLVSIICVRIHTAIYDFCIYTLLKAVFAGKLLLATTSKQISQVNGL